MSEKQIGLIQEYVALLLEWNKRMNLVSRRDETNIWERHILHSASLLFTFEFPPGSHVIDIGSGGGLPGIPLKILQPDLNVMLVDSIRKKVNALRDIAARLALSGVSAEVGRAEDLGKKTEFHKKFDIAVARAVAPLQHLVTWSRPFLKDRQGGFEVTDEHLPKRLRVAPPALLAMKGGDLVGEISKAQRVATIRHVRVVDLGLRQYEESVNYDKKVVYVLF